MRVLLGIIGAVIVLGIFASVLRTLVIPRPTPAGFTGFVQRSVSRPFRFMADRLPGVEAKDRVLAPVAPVSIVITLLGWLVSFMLGYGLLEAAVSGLGVHDALYEAGSSLFTLGFASSRRTGLTAIDFCAAATGPIVVGLQIGYLPTLYNAYQRRETEVTLLQTRAGAPPWGPQILARYAQVDLLDDIDDLFRSWEQWCAVVSETHTTYPVLIHFRSPKADRNWLIALLAVLDAAALRLAFNPSQPQARTRLALRAGFVCLRDIADIRGIPYDADPLPEDPVRLGYEDFLRGVERMHTYGYPMERTAQEAWPHFRGWRVNYETLAYRLAQDIDAVPAPWSGPRRTALSVWSPLTPVDRHPAE
ncbi:hypothetical protein [Streptomyces sp. PSAA01]|uniref:hypothetical protein n=1 Tax=Streptomyces sp. PSAA01 TaxID=2912762 RepID=UPI001F313D74|nr:hypothetical protein [Streptomyces sp. PSAA01]MCG0285639.1 hypothetical protein [Streptomyces sp. PSAA01]